jgi:hypothetical protein
VLIITTGSKASDIQREAELLPGRKGKLARTIYLFVQLPYKIFYDKAFPTLKAQTGRLSHRGWLTSRVCGGA